MKQASNVRLGIPADDLLNMRGRGIRNAIKAPTVKGSDEKGRIVDWHYSDGTAEIRHRQGRYRVVKWSSRS